MKLRSLKFLNDYKQFKANQTFIFSQEDNNTSEKNVEMSIFVGRNGSGKTTLMSLIPTLFHHLERYSNNIPADFILIYNINFNNLSYVVTISHIRNLVRININGIYNNIQIMPKRDSQNYDRSVVNLHEDYITYDDIINYLPQTIVTSTFSMHGEYPESRRSNYSGHKIIANKSISNIYGKNHYSIGSISLGIARFITAVISENSELKEVLDLFDLSFTGRIQTYTIQYQFDIHPPRNRRYIEDIRHSDLITIDENWINTHEEQLNAQENFFINDIEFNKNDKTIRLSTMSSGEKMLLIRCFTILNAIQNNSLVIIEEPELHLDQVWNRELSTLINTLFKDYSCHVLIATHDYSLINSVKNDYLIPINNGEKIDLQEKTFLASYDELFKTLYGEKGTTNKLEKDFLKSIAMKTPQELKEDYEILGNSIYKYLVLRQIKELE